MLRVHELQSLDDCERYYAFMAEVYQDDPCWVPIDKHHVVSIISKKSPYESHSETQAFWVEKDVKRS